MKRTSLIVRHSATACAFALGLAGVAMPTSALNAASAETSRQPVILLSVGESKVINLASSMSDVVIAKPEVLDVHVRSQNQLYLMGKLPGESTIFVTSKTGKVLYSATVRIGNNLTSIDQMLKLALPDADITVSNMNGITLLTGTVKAPEDAAEAERLVDAFLNGRVTDPKEKTTVVGRLQTATPLQVNLQVKISEVNRTLVHKVGTNFTGLGTGSGSFSGYLGRSTRSAITDQGAAVGGLPGDISRRWLFNQPSDNSTTVGFIAKLFGMDLAGALDLAESNGLATTLAQPNLTSLSGETASFLAGGEYPYQVSNGTQGNSIEFKQYGVQLAFTPTVLSDGRVSLRVRPTVSSLDFSISSSVPALRTRTAETTVELGSGQSFMIAGLLNNDTANAIDKVPGIGNIPILGSLFKSRRFQRNETELVIVVTPYLVRPVNAADIRTPTDGFRNATELQGLLFQQGSDGVNGAKAPVPSLAPANRPADPATAPVAPQAAADAPKRGKTAKPKRTASADTAPTPGFSF
ncbi:type II and III secretion system protein family protein [Sphingobium subterraneum]|uniref:Pilus assembly protein CpaC n=1 Tax=Sphingobium subterraneum TaxID=627688 RepID=A0A841J9G2_9SPHN|nr:type II and III secretion system protein family protein [Sphingobium subterraneum]MBB6124791.1 pilus assembly protein CpaC [Sphingobium subterraneum]